MSREIKFRLWNEYSKCMENAGDRPFTISPWGIPLYDGFHLQDRVVMQYTGLKDKNGKDIYEGDIVSGGRLVCTGNHAIENEKTTVIFESGMFKAGKISLCSFNKGCEIIGNIYENPKLRKGGQA